MSQEATIILMDNSNYMRNGDFVPNRFQAEKEALQYVCNNKRRQNIENTCGLVTSANCQVICTLTSDPGKIGSKLQNIDLEDESTFARAVAVAHLVLRNRIYRNQKPRIIAFVGSPVNDTIEDLTKLGKKLKKEKVHIIIINFGETTENEKILFDFVDILNGSIGEVPNNNEISDHSILINIPTGSGLQEYLSTHPALIRQSLSAYQTSSSPIIIQQNDFPLTDDDPDLAYALRISMEDQRMREEAAVREALLNSDNRPFSNISPTRGHTDEEVQLNQLLTVTNDIPGKRNSSHLSNSKLNKTGLPKTSKKTSKQISKESDPVSLNSTNLQAMTDEEQIAYAISMSMHAMQNQQPVPNESSEPKIRRKSNASSDSEPKIKKKRESTKKDE